jgi:hypothetical protein
MEAELLASQIYAITAIPAPQMRTDQVSIYYDYHKTAKPKPKNQWTQNHFRQCADLAVVGFIIDNRDWLGEINGNNNVLWDQNDQPFAIDHGSAFDFRATGPRKDQPYNTDPKQIEKTFIRSATKGQARFTMQSLTELEFRQHCRKITTRFTPETFKALKEKFPNSERNIVAMEAHVKYYAEIADGKREMPKEIREFFRPDDRRRATKDYHIPPRRYVPVTVDTSYNSIVSKYKDVTSDNLLNWSDNVFEKYYSSFTKQKPGLDKETSEACKAMKTYTHGGYKGLNSTLADRLIDEEGNATPIQAKGSLKKNLEHYKRAANLFNIPCPKDMVVKRRGILLPDEKSPLNKAYHKYVPDNIYDSFTKGTEWNIFTWISTSVHWMSVNRKYPDNYIYIPKGTMIMPVGKYSSMASEEEIILTPMTRFRILDIVWRSAEENQFHYAGIDRDGKKVVIAEVHLLLTYKELDEMR